MQRELGLAGFRLTADEWNAFDDASRAALLDAVGARDADELMVDPPYESFELVFD